MTGAREGEQVQLQDLAVQDLAVVVVTSIPSPYQVEFFDMLARDGFRDFAAIYTKSDMGKRRWRRPQPRHRHLFMDGDNIGDACAWVDAADLVVFSGYRGPFFTLLMRGREAAVRPWALWAERPGFRFKGNIGRLGRAILQRRIRRHPIAIWGIGQWAVDGYRDEIAGERLYVDIPYFSNLDRFLGITRDDRQADTTRFLFSGEMSTRKGVDLLASAFVDLIRSGGDARLTFMGAGPLEQKVRRIVAPVAERVDFAGFRQWHELPDVYRDHDVLVAPSRYDGWGLIVPEGLAAGMPVIGTAAMGSARDLVSQDAGWVVAEDEIAPLAEAMHAVVGQSADARAEFLCSLNF